jgi:glutamyl-tRNA synthetase
VTLPELAAEGMQPDAVLGLIAGSLDLAAAGERVTLDAMLERFDPGRLPRRPWVVMAEKFTGAKRLRRDSP